MVCQHDVECDCYHQGKEASLWEMINALRAGHAPDCGCDPCYAARSVISGFIFKRKVPPESSGNPWVCNTLKLAEDFVFQVVRVTVHAQVTQRLSAAAVSVDEVLVHRECAAIAESLLRPSDASQEWVGYIVRTMQSAGDAGAAWADGLIAGLAKSE